MSIIANIINIIVKNLQIYELKKNIEEGNIEYLFFPKEIELKKISNKNDKKDYIIKAIKKGYKITKNTPDYIKKDKRYLNCYIDELRKRIIHNKYNDLYGIYGNIIQNLNSDKDYILKAIENGYDILKGYNEYIMSNPKYIKYYINVTKNIDVLNRISQSILEQICKENSDLMFQYIDYAIKKKNDASFIGNLDTNYIVYYIKHVEVINGEELDRISEDKWEKIKKEYSNIIDLAFKKSIYINENIPEFIKQEHQNEIKNTILNNILNRKYENLWNIDEEILLEFAKKPDIVKKIIKIGYKEIIYYTETNKENEKLYLEELLEKNDFLLKYINEITHKEFKKYSEFIFMNEQLTTLLYEIEKQKSFLNMSHSSYIENEIYNVEDKLLELLKVTRINGMNIDYELLLKIDDELIKKYKSKIYEELLLKEKNIFNINNDTKMSVLDAIGIFGLFEDDKIGVNVRLNKLKEIINKIPNKITEEEYNKILNDFNDKQELINKSFKKIIGKKYIKKENTQIPSSLNFYEDYFVEELNEKKYSFLKKLLPDGTVGSDLNKFLKNSYTEQDCIYYQLNNLTNEEKAEIRNIIQNTYIEGSLTKYSLHKIMSGFKQEYDKDFYEYFIKNLELILIDEKNQRLIKEIQNNFEQIKLESTTEQPTYEKTIEYINKPNYNENIDEGFIKELKRAGVTSKDASDYYYNLHNETSKIDETALPNYEKEYEEIVNNIRMKFRARRLEKNDPLLVLVGEKNYTNCCQSYKEAGQDCNKYSAMSKYSSVFITEVLYNGKWTMLTQSWDWVNNDVYCHDNIEGTSMLKTHHEFQNIIRKMYEEHARYILEISKKTIEEYINQKEQITEQTRNQLENQIIKMVTVGTTYNDIDIKKYYKKNVKNPKGPINYHSYRDSNNQIIICGNETKVEKKYSMNQLCIYKENKNIKNCNVMSLTKEEKQRINVMLQQDIQNIYNDAQIIFNKNWAIIYRINNEEITIEDIKIIELNNDNLQELATSLKKLIQIYPQATVKNYQSNLQEYIDSIEKLQKNDGKIK